MAEKTKKALKPGPICKYHSLKVGSFGVSCEIPGSKWEWGSANVFIKMIFHQFFAPSSCLEASLLSSIWFLSLLSQSCCLSLFKVRIYPFWAWNIFNFSAIFILERRCSVTRYRGSKITPFCPETWRSWRPPCNIFREQINVCFWPFGSGSARGARIRQARFFPDGW